MSDLNWYAPESRLQKPRKPRVWPWLLAIACLLLLVGMGTLVVVVNRMKGDQSLSEYLESGSFLDSSRTRDVYGEPEKERVRMAVQAFQRAGAVPVVTAAEQQKIETFLRKLEQTLRFGDTAGYAALFDKTRFNQQVLECGFLSADARMSFLGEFSGWHEFQPEVTGTNIHLVRVEKELNAAAGSTQLYRAYTWVYSSDSFPQRIVWLISISTGGTLLYDFEWVEDGASYSQLAAREYSGAYTGKRWDHYVALFTEQAPSAENYLAEAKNLEKKYPRCLYETVLLRFSRLASGANLHEDALQLSNLLSERAAIPTIEWVRAWSFHQLGKNEQALESLNKFAATVGEAPDTAVLRAQIYLAMGETEKAGVSYASALMLNPDDTHLPYNYAEYISDAQWSGLIKSMSQLPRGTSIAAAIGLRHVDSRPKVAEQFLKVAQTAEVRTPKLCLFEAEWESRNGNFEKAESLYREGWRKLLARRRKQTQEPDAAEGSEADTENADPGPGTNADEIPGVEEYDPDEYSLQVGWESCLLAGGRLEEMVQTSLDPVSTFTNNVLDEGSIYVSIEELRRFVEALESTAAPYDDQIIRVELGKHVARALLELHMNQHQAAWDKLWPMLNPEHTLTPEESEAMEADWGDWLLREWCAIAGTHCGRIPDAFKLRVEDGFSPFALMANTADQYQLTEELSRIIQLQMRLDSADPLLPLYQLKLALLQGRDQQALESFIELWQKDEDSPYIKNNLLLTKFSSPVYWDQLFKRLPPDQVFRVLSGNYSGAFSVEDAERLIRMGEDSQLSKSQILPMQILVSYRKGDQESLGRFLTEWMSMPSDQLLEEDSGYVLAGSRVEAHNVPIDYLIGSNQLELAQQFVSHIERGVDAESWYWKSILREWKTALLIAEGKVAEVQEGFSSSNSSEAADLASAFRNQWNSQFRIRLLNRPEWQPVRAACAPFLTFNTLSDYHPISSTGMTLLFRTGDAPTADRITNIARTVSPNCVVETLPDEKHATYRVSTEAGSFVVRCGSGVPELIERWQQNLVNDVVVISGSERNGPLVQSISGVSSWVEILADDLSVNSTANALETEFLELVQGLQNDHESILWYSDRLYPTSVAVLDAIEKGTVFEKGSFEPFISNVDYLSDSVVLAQQQRKRRLLETKLAPLSSNSTLQGFSLKVNYGGATMNWMIPVEVVSWRSKDVGYEFLVRTDNSPILPPSKRNSLFTVTNWGIEDWSLQESQ